MKMNLRGSDFLDSPLKSNRFMFWLLIHLCIAPFIVLFISYPISKIIDIKFFILSITPLYCFLIPLFIYKNFTFQRLRDIVPMKRLSLKNIILIFFMSLAIQPIIMIISSVTNIFFNNDVSDLMIELSDIPFWEMLLSIAIAPAICEELIFRGIILTGYKNSGLLKASITTGFFFGIMHLNPHQFFYAFIIGIFFTFLIHYTGSIFSTMLSHFVINGTQVLLLYLSNSKSTEISHVSITISEKLLIIYSSIIFSLPFIPIFISLFLLFIHTNKNNDNYINNSKANEKIFSILFLFTIIIYVLYIFIFN